MYLATNPSFWFRAPAGVAYRAREENRIEMNTFDAYDGFSSGARDSGFPFIVDLKITTH